MTTGGGEQRPVLTLTLPQLQQLLALLPTTSSIESIADAVDIVTYNPAVTEEAPEEVSTLIQLRQLQAALPATASPEEIAELLDFATFAVAATEDVAAIQQIAEELAHRLAKDVETKVNALFRAAREAPKYAIAYANLEEARELLAVFPDSTAQFRQRRSALELRHSDTEDVAMSLRNKRYNFWAAVHMERVLTRVRDEGKAERDSIAGAFAEIDPALLEPVTAVLYGTTQERVADLFSREERIAFTKLILNPRTPRTPPGIF